MSKRIVKALNFEGEGAHVALVSKGANQQEVLLMKKKAELKKVADEVLISTSMQTFLTAFFHMWEDDAAELATILGYEPQEWTYDIIGDDTEVTLLKGLTNEDKVSQELYGKIEEMGEKFTNLLKEGKNMKTEKVEVDLQKSIDDAVKIALEKATAANVAAIEAKDTEIADLRKAEDTRVKDEYIELCKGYSFVEDADVLATTLFKCKGIEGFDVILTTLEKARTAMTEALETETGTEEEADLNKGEEVPENLSKTAELIKARYNKETK